MIARDALAALVAVAAAAAAGCHRDINLLSPADAGSAGAGSGGQAGGGAGGSAKGGGGGAGGNPACSGVGPPIVLPTSTGAPCAAALATRGHRYVLCSCEAMNAPARIRTGAFDSTNPTATDDVSAAIGIGGDLNANAEVRAAGAIHVAGANGFGIRAWNQIRTNGTLRVGGPLAMYSDNATIGTDAFINGDISGGSVTIAQTLHVPPTATLSGDVRYAAIVRETVATPNPCDCSAGFVDVAPAIGAAAASNADAAIGLAPTALAVPGATPPPIELFCGTYFLTSIEATAPVTLAVHGRALLAVAGNVTLGNAFTVTLDSSAELDLLVGGHLTTGSSAVLGAPGAPARFRIWIAGTSSVVFDGAPAVSAVVHAAAAAVTAPAGLPLSGSLLARSISIGADSMLTYDRAILAAGMTCGEPAAPYVP